MSEQDPKIMIGFNDEDEMVEVFVIYPDKTVETLVAVNKEIAHEYPEIRNLFNELAKKAFGVFVDKAKASYKHSNPPKG